MVLAGRGGWGQRRGGFYRRLAGRKVERVVSKQLGQLVAQYVRERRNRQEIMASSAKTMRYVLLTFVDVAGWESDPARLTKRDVQRWLARPHLDPGTLRSHFSVVRGFCVWLAEEGHARRDVTLGVKPPKEPQRLPRGLKLAQVQAIIAACPDTRSEVVTLLMCQETMRACEVAALQVGDIDFDERLILVRGKGRKQRVVALTDEMAEAIGRYLRERPARTGPLIRHIEWDRAIGAKYISELMGKLMRSAGVGETGHALRHTAVTDMLRAGAHIRDVQQAAGHASIATTQTYMPWLVGDLHKAMGGRSYQPDRTPQRREATGDDGPQDAA